MGISRFDATIQRSMLASAALGMWTQGMSKELRAKVFVDDYRLLLGNDYLHLQHLFHAGEFWVSYPCFSTKDETVAFENKDTDGNLQLLDGVDVKRDKQGVCLGIPLPFTGLARFDFLDPIFQKCILHSFLDRISTAKVQQQIAAKAIARKVIPAA